MRKGVVQRCPTLLQKPLAFLFRPITGASAEINPSLTRKRTFTDFLSHDALSAYGATLCFWQRQLRLLFSRSVFIFLIISYSVSKRKCFQSERFFLFNKQIFDAVFVKRALYHRRIVHFTSKQVRDDDVFWTRIIKLFVQKRKHRLQIFH